MAFLHDNIYRYIYIYIILYILILPDLVAQSSITLQTVSFLVGEFREPISYNVCLITQSVMKPAPPQFWSMMYLATMVFSITVVPAAAASVWAIAYFFFISTYAPRCSFMFLQVSLSMDFLMPIPKSSFARNLQLIYICIIII